MRCLSCNTVLTDFESTRKGLNTNEYLDLCNSCFYTIRDDVLTLDRSDLEEEDDGYLDDFDSNECLDYGIDMDS
jgi:hypothetical protein